MVRQGLYRRFSKVPVELTFLITLTSMLKAKFFTVKKKERKKKRRKGGCLIYRTLHKAGGLAESSKGSNNAWLCLEKRGEK